MRVNVYAEELTNRVEIIGKEIDGQVFTGLRIYLELPATVGGQHYQGPFIHKPGDDDSSAVTFWGKQDFRMVIAKALCALDQHYGYSYDALSIAKAAAAQSDAKPYMVEGWLPHDWVLLAIHMAYQAGRKDAYA